MRIQFYPICFVACVLLSVKTFSQSTTTGAWGTLTERPNTPIDEMIGGFIEILPPGYNPSDPSKKYPLIIFLEGISQFGNGDPTELPYMYGSGEGMLPDIVRKGELPTNNNFTVGSETFSFIIIAPQIRMQVRNGRPDPEQLASPAEVNDIINYALQYYRVDPTRIYLLGTSLGGGSAWNYPGYSVYYANRLAAIVPFAGASNLWDDHSRVSNIAAANLPVWTFANENNHPFDTLAQRYIDSINLNHPEHTQDAFITIYPEPPGTVDHNSWNIPLKGGSLQPPTGPATDIYQWLLSKQETSQTQPDFAAVTASVDQSILNLANGSMVLGAHGISFTGATVTLTGTVSPTSGQSIQWKRVIGNGGTITSPNSLQTTVTDLKPGFYVFQLRVTDGQGLTSVANVNVTVNAPPENKYAKVEAESYSTSTGSAGIDKTLLDEGSAYGANFFGPGSSVQYNVIVPTSGTYALYYRYMSDCCTPSLNILSGGNLVTAKPLNSNNTWQTDSIHITLSTNSSLTFQAEHWAFNYFELAQIAAEVILPIKFVYFNTQCTGSTVKVQWSTAQEQNSRDFSVQRSTDGINWSEMGRLAAAGQSGQQNSYMFEDKNPVGLGMYRIVEYDVNGQSSISSIVRSSCSSKETISLYPNPSTGSSALNVSVEQSTALTVLVLDSKGALMQQSHIQLPSGNSIVPLNIGSYPRGVYTVNIQLNNKVKTFKLIKN